jgi:hypothetical protein
MSARNSGPHRFSASQDFLPGTQESAGETKRKTMNLAKQLYDIGYFFRALRARLRFGRFSRVPLRLLRLELRGNSAECDWMARPADPWDADLPRPVGERHASLQALEDAILVRDLLFGALPGANAAAFRVYRESTGTEPELIIAGTVTREKSAARSSRSLAMRAKLLGLQFLLEDGILEALRSEECAMSF